MAEIGLTLGDDGDGECRSQKIDEADEVDCELHFG